jgi:hypothetical protein
VEWIVDLILQFELIVLGLVGLELVGPERMEGREWLDRLGAMGGFAGLKLVGGILPLMHEDLAGLVLREELVDLEMAFQN